MAKYVVTLGSEDGPLLTGPTGSTLVYDNPGDAGEAASANAPAFVVILRATQYYHKRKTVYVDAN